MARVDAVATFLNKLDDVETIIGFHDIGHALAVVQVKCRVGILGQQHRAALETRLTAIDGCCLILAVKDGKGRELALTTVHLVGIVTQTGFHLVNFLLWNDRIDGDDLRFDLQGDIGQRVLGHAVVELAHIGGRGLDILCQLVLHLLDAVLVGINLVEFLAQSGQGHAEVLFHLLLGTQIGDEEVDAALDLGTDS